jgi:hypothetical protein
MRFDASAFVRDWLNAARNPEGALVAQIKLAQKWRNRRDEWPKGFDKFTLTDLPAKLRGDAPF